MLNLYFGTVNFSAPKRFRCYWRRTSLDLQTKLNQIIWHILKKKDCTGQLKKPRKAIEQGQYIKRSITNCTITKISTITANLFLVKTLDGSQSLQLRDSFVNIHTEGLWQEQGGQIRLCWKTSREVWTVLKKILIWTNKTMINLH